MVIFVCILIGIIIFYKVIIPYIHDQYHPTTEKKITKGLLSMSFWQILFSSLVCAYAFGLEPVYKQTDEDVSSFLQKHSEVGDLINEYTGINGYSNFNYLMSESQYLHTYATVFIVVAVIIALVIAIGSIGKKLDRRVVEGLAILNTLACCWIAKSSTDLYEAIIRDGATLQTIAWIGRLLGTDIYAAMDMMIRSIWILPIILIIKHFFYHKTLNEYYLPDTVANENVNNEESPISDYSKQATANNNITETVPDSDTPVNDDVVVVQEKEEILQQIEPVEETKEPLKENVETEKEQPDLIIPDDESSSSRFWLVLGGIVIVGFIGFLYWQYNNNTNSYQDNVTSRPDEIKSENYEEKSEAIISRLTGEYGNKIEIIGKYPELSEYIAFVFRKDWKDCLILKKIDESQQVEFDFPLRIDNRDRCGTPTKAFDSKDKSKILIIGENGGNGFADMAFLLEYNPLADEIRELGWGLNLEEQKDWIKITRRWTTFWDEENFNHEYAFIDIYYDLNGDLIPSPLKGEPYQFKGKINNRYAVTMQLSIKNNKIYGEYFCDKNKSENVLFLYGGISSGRDIVLLEFNDAGQQTGMFKGRLTSNSLEGTFTNNAGVEMPFELYPIVDSSKSQSSTNASTNAYIPDRDAEFPGGMVGLGQYISENLQYPADAKAKGISGNVRVSYIIDKDGSITDVKVIESVNPELDKEAIRLISSMPKWKPGIRKSKVVKMRTSTVISFKLE